MHNAQEILLERLVTSFSQPWTHAHYAPCHSPFAMKSAACQLT